MKKILILVLFLVLSTAQYTFAFLVQLTDFSTEAITEGFDDIPLLSDIPNFDDFDVVGLGGTPTAVNDTVQGLVGDFFPVSAPIVVGMDGQGITNGKSVKFVFHKPLFQVGAYLIDVEQTGGFFTAYGENGEVLESLSLQTQGQSGLSQFYGIQNENIRSIVIGTDSFEGIAFDDLTYTVDPIPEPITLTLLGIGLIGISFKIK